MVNFRGPGSSPEKRKAGTASDQKCRTIAVAGRLLMTCFQPCDDAAYINWLQAHSDGYVINTEPSGRGDMKLHRAICRTIRYRPPFIGPSYVKVCSTSLEEADDWARQRRGEPAPRCRAMQCWP